MPRPFRASTRSPAASPAPVFEHLLRLTDRRGTSAQARLATPLPKYGYRAVDMARVLIVATRDHGPDRTMNCLAAIALRFLNDAQVTTGACRNHMDSDGSWVDEPALEDAWGRCIWGLGTAAAHSNLAWTRQSAISQFERAAQERSKQPRAMAFAALGAAELLALDPDQRSAHALIADYAASAPSAYDDAVWPWPEPRLTSANAVVPEAMIVAGVVLNDSTLRRRGLDLLAWLLAFEMGDGHLTDPGYRQRSRRHRAWIRSAAHRGGCTRGRVRTCCQRRPRHDLARRRQSRGGLVHGRQRRGEPMWDPHTGGGYDGLHADGVDNDQGAEATVSVISTLQHARRLSTARQ